MDAYVDRHENQEGKEDSSLLVEMHPNLPDGYGCVLTPLIVYVTINTTVPVHVFNLHSFLVVIRQVQRGSQVSHSVSICVARVGLTQRKDRDKTHKVL